MFLVRVCVFIGGVMAESSTCDASYNDNCKACAFYNFGCGIVNDTTYVVNAFLDIPKCFTGRAQSPINLDSSSATIADDLGQLTFSGYTENVTWPGPPVLRLKDFTVQLDFNPLGPKKREGKKKRQRKRRKNQSKKRSRRDEVNLPSISGGVLGNNRWVFLDFLSFIWACHHFRY